LSRAAKTETKRSPAWLIFLHGPPGAGKLTVGRSLQSLTGYPLFHNHLVVDLLEAVFEFGSQPFVALRERIWLDVFREAARMRRSLIFTFAPERTVDPGFPATAESIVESQGGRVLFVAVRCAESVLERRLSDPSRSRFGKLDSPQRYRELRDSGAFEFPPLRVDLELDTDSLAPERAAALIQSRLAAA
jgi:chloramphenicol 3-O-phosphotransferase